MSPRKGIPYSTPLLFASANGCRGASAPARSTFFRSRSTMLRPSEAARRWSHRIPSIFRLTEAFRISIRRTSSPETGSSICPLAKIAHLRKKVFGRTLDIGRGVSGSLRANVVPGQAIGVANRSALEWFNTAAFCAPGINCVNPSGSAFGDAGRNIIEGPGAITFDMSLNRTIPIRESRSLDLRVAANNVFNHVNYASINTVVNSLTYGQVTSAGGMRRLTLQARFRF